MCLFPKSEYKSAYDIPFGCLYEKGIRGVIFDIDNTLVLHDAPADDRSTELFVRLKQIGFKTCILSNNDEPRVRDFAHASGDIPYVYKAGKPRSDGYERAVRLMGLDTAEAVFVGDQIFTDIWGANRAHVYSILAGRLGPEKYFHIVLKRIIEAPVRLMYHIFGRNNGIAS